MSWIITPSQKMDLDAALYLSRIEEVEGQALEPSVRDAINTFVVGCKADGTWAAIKASCILAGARTLAGALVPLVGPTPTNFNFVTGDYSRKTGLTGNGSSKYIATGRNANEQSSTNIHMSCFYTTKATSGIYLGARYSGANVQYLFQNVNALIPGRTYSWSFSASQSLLGFSIAGNTATFIADQAVSSPITVVSTLAVNAAVSVFARNNSGVIDNYSNARLAFYSIGESLNLALLDARITALMNALAAAIP